MPPDAKIEAISAGYGTQLVTIDAPRENYVVQGSVALVNQGDRTATVDCFISQQFSGGAGSNRSGRLDETSVTLAPGGRETVPVVTAASLIGPVLMCEGREGLGHVGELDPIQPETAKLTVIQVSELP
jgi:hypothetical protein